MALVPYNTKHNLFKLNIYHKNRSGIWLIPKINLPLLRALERGKRGGQNCNFLRYSRELAGV